MVDLTWCTSDICGRFGEWRVREDIESLSDHLYITMEMDHRGTAPINKRGTPDRLDGGGKGALSRTWISFERRSRGNSTR